MLATITTKVAPYQVSDDDISLAVATLAHSTGMDGEGALALVALAVQYLATAADLGTANQVSIDTAVFHVHIRCTARRHVSLLGGL